MKLGLLTAPFPETPLDGRRRLDGRQRLRGPRDRLLAAADRPDPPLRRHEPHRRRQPVRRARRRRSRRDRGEGPDDLRPRLLPEPAPSRPGAPGDGHRPPQARHRRRPRRWTSRSSTRSWAATRRRTRTRTGRRRSGSGRTSSRFAHDHGRKITLENCPMLFSYDEWPGGHNIATTPRMWRRILEQWGGTIGLNFDPSHLILQMIDIPRFLREFGPHILHFQAKDLMIDRDGPLRARHLLDGHRLADPAHPGPRRGRLGRRPRRAVPRRATTATASSSTRTAASRAPTRRSSAASSSPATSSGRTVN